MQICKGVQTLSETTESNVAYAKTSIGNNLVAKPTDGMGSLSVEKPLWVPGKEVVASTRLESLRKTVNKKYSLQLESYADLHKWSVTQRSNFWAEVWEIGEIIHSEPYTQVVDESLPIDAIPKWFIGAKLNFAENLLEKGKDDDIAVYYKGEGHPITQKLTYAQLRKEVSAWASALKSLGVTKGDVVAGILPNCSETLCAVLATASIGAIWTCTSPDYGTTGVVERFKQTEPKVVISVNAVFYNGKTHGMREKLETIVAELTSVKHVVVIPFLTTQNEESKSFSYENWTWSSDLLDDIRSSKIQIQYEQLTSDHPLFIMYSSGTTGTPKCLVHSVGGTLLKHAEEHLLQSDLRNTDVIFYYTTVGWMMYNWLISSLMSGCSIVLYDGAPTPALWSLIDELDITIFGTSAKWLSVQEEVFLKNSAETGKSAKDLDKNGTKLRMVLSTGSPLNYIIAVVENKRVLYGESSMGNILENLYGEFCMGKTPYNNFARNGVPSTQSLKFENKLYASVKEKMEEMQQHNMSWIEVQFLKKAVDILCQCRQTLMFTYVFAFYLQKTNQSVIFEDNQRDLESATEKLSEYLERDITSENLADIKQKVQDKYRYCDSRRQVLLDHVYEGYEKDWWVYNDQ